MKWNEMPQMNKQKERKNAQSIVIRKWKERRRTFNDIEEVEEEEEEEKEEDDYVNLKDEWVGKGKGQLEDDAWKRWMHMLMSALSGWIRCCCRDRPGTLNFTAWWMGSRRGRPEMMFTPLILLSTAIGKKTSRRLLSRWPNDDSADADDWNDGVVKFSWKSSTRSAEKGVECIENNANSAQTQLLSIFPSYFFR